MPDWTNSLALGAWKAVKEVLNRGIPNSPAEGGLLLEILGDLAKAVDKHNLEGSGDTFDMRLNKAKMTAIWHSCNMFALNSWGNESEKGLSMNVMSLLAPKLDSLTIGSTLDLK